MNGLGVGPCESFGSVFLLSSSGLPSPAAHAGKINQVKSKWGVGCAAVLTVVASLTMSVGVCTYFGLNISVRGR